MLVDVDDVFCRYAIEHGFVGNEDLEACRAIQKQEAKAGRHYYVGQILIRKRLLSCEDFLEIENALEQKIYECAGCKTRYARKDLAAGIFECKGCKQRIAVDGRGRLSMAEILASRDPRDLTISLVSGAPAAAATADPLTTRTSDRRRHHARTSERRADLAPAERPERAERADGKPEQSQRKQRLNRKALEVAPGDLEALERYEILEELGRGGMGVVFKARQIDIDRLCALKVIKAGPNVPDVQINRFVQEGKSAARLGHPNIVTIYDCGRHRDMFFVAMELIPGRPLATLLTEQGRLSIDQGLSIFLDLLAAVHYAHEHGVIHRDLKPGNILVEDDRGRARLIDFGLAKDHEQSMGLTQEGQILGSPFYLSPEQTRGRSKDVDARSDIFAMGVILYEMLTGQRPFSGRSAAEVYGKILHSRPVPPAALEPEIDQELQALILKALEKDPAERFVSADAFAQAIEAYRKDRAARGSGARRGRNTPKGLKTPRTSARARASGAGPVLDRGPEPRASSSSARHVVVGLLGCGVVAVLALAALSGRQPAATTEPRPPVVVGPTPPTDTDEQVDPLDPDPPVAPPSTAELEFSDAQQWVARHQGDLAGAIERFRDIAGRGGSWGQRAQDEVHRFEALAVGEAAAVTSSARARADEGQLARALLMLEDARARLEGATAAARQVKDEHTRLLAAAKTRATEVAGQVDAALARADVDAAQAAIQGYTPAGVDDVDGVVRAANQRLERALRERASQVETQAERSREELEAALAALDELLRGRRYAEAQARLDELKGHRALALVGGAEATLGRYREVAALARAVLEAVGAAGDQARGANVELDGLKGRVERVEDGVLSVKLASGGILERRLTEVDAELVARLHAMTRGGDAPGAHLARAVFLLLEGRDEAALVAFDEARKGGQDLAAFAEDVRRLERARAAAETPRTTERDPAATSEPVKDDLAMVNIPAGTFLMGVDANRIVADRADEIPGRRVTLGAFRIDRYEVTVRQYAQFLEWVKKNRNPHRQCSSLEPPDKDHTPRYWGDPRLCGEGQPVVGVDWFDAFAFAAWAGKRLPTEAEWERAARSADGRAWPWGTTWDPARCAVPETIWGRPLVTTADAEAFVKWWSTAPRLTFPVNLLPAGKSQDELFHAAGNAAEWVADWYDENYYVDAGNRREDQDPKGPTRGTERVARGGSWVSLRPEDVMCTAREPLAPSSRMHWLGFRCALDANVPLPRRLR